MEGESPTLSQIIAKKKIPVAKMKLKYYSTVNCLHILQLMIWEMYVSQNEKRFIKTLLSVIKIQFLCHDWFSNRMNSLQMFYKMDVLVNITKFTKHLCCHFFFNKVVAFHFATWLKKDFNTDVFLSILLNFYEEFFYRTFSGNYF